MGQVTVAVRACAALLLAFLCSAPLLVAQALHSEEYRNPILWADYSDPDVIRVGNNYLLVASSFSFMPGIPILTSADLVHWMILGHVFPRLDVDPRYSMIGGNRYGGGAWAPSIRFHNGRYYVYFPTPDEGIFMSSASDLAGPWTPPVAVISGAGYEDPCPFWDDDGQAYLVHSRLGAGPLILHRMSPDGRSVLDEGKTIVDDHAALPTLEGPKLYKRNGYYYIFAPYGGVSTGSQVVLRARNIWGPYEHRTVLAQGQTAINGPHQGGYVEAADGKGWFLHFHSAGAYGRIDFLEPVRWENDWPIIGNAPEGAETGEPVSVYAAPLGNSVTSTANPATSDEFTSSELNPQWEWNHNPEPNHWSLLQHPGFLRLYAMPATSLLDARNTLTELGQHPAYSFTASLQLQGMRDGQQAGVSMFSDKPGSIFVMQTGTTRRIQTMLDSKPSEGVAVTGDTVQLRITVDNEMASYSWSDNNGVSFRSLGLPTSIYFSWWKAARPAIFSYNTNPSAPAMGYVDIDWVRYAPTESKNAAAK